MALNAKFVDENDRKYLPSAKVLVRVMNQLVAWKINEAWVSKVTLYSYPDGAWSASILAKHPVVPEKVSEFQLSFDSERPTDEGDWAWLQ